MNKKGFSLIEIIGVVIILGLIALLSFPKVLNSVQGGKNQISEATETLIYTASGQYVNRHMNDFPKTSGNIYCVTLQQLVAENLLTESISGLGNYGLQTKVKVTVDNNKYNYIIDNECTEVN